jgi:hypothetical protein
VKDLPQLDHGRPTEMQLEASHDLTSSAYYRCHKHIGVGAGQGGVGNTARLVRLVLAHVCGRQLQQR